jgi:protocatechuate 3,4-dioxygenase beta subunit
MSQNKHDTGRSISNPRRQALGALGALTALPAIGLPMAAHAKDAWLDSFTPDELAAARSCALIPRETPGPFPLLKILDDPRYVRRDVTESRPGMALTLRLKVIDINKACAPISNAAVYIWQCDKDGLYSGYKDQLGGVDTRGETFMRGLQFSDADGMVEFLTVYPGWYPGRITHIHFQVYLNGVDSTATATSQLAFPQSATKAVYDSPLYAARGQNTSVASIADDGVFADGYKLQKVSIKGSVDAGFQAKLLVGVAA